ncbi:MAG TPA: hypothetical protein VFD15_03180 [Clostridia bacterium]|nr:hypothetical protein [Clostridia bacterium]
MSLFRGKSLYKFTVICIVLAFITLSLVGCGKFSVFKELNVKDKDIPEYYETGKAILGEPGEGEFSGLWATLETETDELAEEDARKIAASYITDNTDYDLVSVRVRHYEKTYLAEYYKDESALEKAGLNKEFDKWPAVSFEEIHDDD